MKVNTNEWFTSRKLEARDYQVEILDKLIPESLENNPLPTVLAACPSAGKTIMSIKAIEDYLCDNPNARVLVLTHGTSILRSQYHDELEGVNPNFTYCMIDSGKDFAGCREQVVVTLPQTIESLKKLSRFDLLVVDEAHQFYFAKTVQAIIKKTRPQHRLLLTGTPSDFINRNYPIIPVTVNELLDGGYVSDIIIENVISYYDVDYNDYDKYRGALRKDVVLTKSDTTNTLDDVVTQILNRLNSGLKNKSKAYSLVKTNLNYSVGFGSLKKTMIACHSQDQAKEIKNYLELKGVNTALSISDTDKDSDEIKRFKDEEDCMVLLVVGRGILGFSFKKLVNVIDMTLTHNVNRIFQLMARAIRLHPDGEEKIFFKVAPPKFAEYFRHIMTCVLMLTDKEWYLKFNGKNFLDMEIPIKESRKRKGEVRTSEPRKKGKIKPVMVDGIPAIEFFKDLMVKMRSGFDGYAYTRMGDVKQELYNEGDRVGRGFWTKENVIDDAKKYDTITEWSKNSTSYQVANLNGWTKEATTHMISTQVPYGFWQVKQNVLDDAKKYDTITEWQKGNGTGYNVSTKRGWTKEATAHMINTQVHHGFWQVKQNVLDDAKKYRIKKDWVKNSSGASDAAYRYGWFDEATTHMKKRGHK